LGTIRLPSTACLPSTLSAANIAGVATCAAPPREALLFAFPRDIRKLIYTTNAVESLHRSLRKIIKTRGSFPNDEAALKLLFPALRNAGVHWRKPIEWMAALGQLAILFGSRFSASAR
jgi:transposase-like protein